MVVGVEEHLDKLAAPRVIHHKLFSDFSAQFRTLIGVNCERRLYFPRETIVREGTTGDRMYIMNLGSASVKVAKQSVMQIRGGSHFGFNMICSDKEKYTMTITTDTMCQVLIITRSSYQHALGKYPEMKEVALHLEASERTRERKQFAGFMKLVHRRRGLRYLLEAMRDGMLSEAKNSAQMNDGNKSTLQTVIKGWRQEVAKSAELRQGDEQLRQFNDAQIYNWLQKRTKLRIEQMKPERERSRWMIDTLSNRGPAGPKPKLERQGWTRTERGPSRARGHRSEEASPRLPPIVSSSLVYLFESDLCDQSGLGCAGPGAFSSIPASFWWAISTLTTVGYGDMVPQSALGKVIGATTAVVGLLVVSIAISLVSLNFKQTFLEEKAKLAIHNRHRRRYFRDGKDIDEKLQNFEERSQDLLNYIDSLSEKQEAKAQLQAMLGILKSHRDSLIHDVGAFKSQILNLRDG
eukprot:s1458_g13.t1